MALDKTCAQPLYQQLEELLRSWMDSGKLHPGERIPGEVELAQTYHVSRMTARRAVDTLVLEGILFRQPGKGTFVAEPKTPYPPASAHSFSQTMQALGVAVTTQVLAQQVMPAPSPVARDLGLVERSEVLFLRRLRYTDGVPTLITISYIPIARFPSLVNEDFTTRPLNEIMERASGMHIVTSRDYVEAALARADEAALLGIRRGAPVLLTRGVVYAEGDLPVRSTKSVFRGDHFRFLTAGNCLVRKAEPARDSLAF